MNKFAIGALAVTTASSLAYAGGTETKEWSTFDRDILALTSSQGPTAAGLIDIHGFVRGRGAWSQEVDVDPVAAGGQNLGGFSLDNARGEMSVSQGDYGALITFDILDNGSVVQVLDAFGTFKLPGVEGITGEVGRFKPPFLWSSFMVNDNNMALLDHTFNAQNWQGRQDGVQFGGMWDTGGGPSFAWWAAMQNGSDGVESEYQWTARAQVTLMGNGVGKQEGAYGSSGDLSLMLGAGYSNDEGVDQPGKDKGSSWCVDGVLSQGQLSLHFELVDYQDDVMPGQVINLNTGVINALNHAAAGTDPSETPWSATAGYMLVPDKCEVVVRYEDLDSVQNTVLWTLGVNWYMAGHNAKWTLQGSRADSDDNAKEADTVAFGLCVGA